MGSFFDWLRLTPHHRKRRAIKRLLQSNRLTELDVQHIMMDIRRVLRDTYTEDNYANTYWLMRDALDMHFETYLKSLQENQDFQLMKRIKEVLREPQD
ncbi:MAG: hypothetical protein JKX96_04430 [Acinetobacter sp.]|nr:hypothetical protein [Acinetobacter sp.]